MASGGVKHLVGHATEDPALHAGAAVSGHRDQRIGPSRRSLHGHVGRFPDAHGTLRHSRIRQGSAERLQIGEPVPFHISLDAIGIAAVRGVGESGNGLRVDGVQQFYGSFECFGDGPGIRQNSLREPGSIQWH